MPTVSLTDLFITNLESLSLIHIQMCIRDRFKVCQTHFMAFQSTISSHYSLKSLIIQVRLTEECFPSIINLQLFRFQLNRLFVSFRRQLILLSVINVFITSFTTFNRLLLNSSNSQCLFLIISFTLLSPPSSFKWTLDSASLTNFSSLCDNQNINVASLSNGSVI